MSAKTYRDKCKCPTCKYSYIVIRRTANAGRVVGTYCPRCERSHKAMAGSVPTKRGVA